MDDNFKFRASMRSDEELRERVDNREKYLPETVEASVEELKIRGVEFSEDEDRVIAEDMQAQRDIVAAANSNSGGFNRVDKALYTDDPDAPEYYTKRIIVIFSMLFSVFFGSIMMAVNLSKTQNAAKAVLAVLYGFAFTAVVAIIAANYNINTGIAIISGYVGAYTMELLFWNRYIGATTVYRPKPFWIPLIIGLSLSVALIYLIIKYGKV